jgi:hypothetical protein
MQAEGVICLNGQEATMSADFSVKPVGVPASVHIVRPAPEAAREAVRTQLPPAQSVTASETTKALRRESVQIDRELEPGAALSHGAPPDTAAGKGCTDDRGTGAGCSRRARGG